MTRIDVDDKLLERAQRVGGSLTREQVVSTALEEFVRQHEQLQIVELFGTVEYEPDYDYKQQRKRA
ncbi:MAG TPA: type II toxin-antitoxin system VapB family antitoxin [Humisphaera sp.]|nr:type II toxin-antitoxin system VapB family antitoxin [Humisphaera sp.]